MPVINADNRDVMKRILDENDAFLFDCDGVLWSTGHTFPGAVEAIQKLQDSGKKVLYVTNNSTKTRQQYLEKIESYGIKAEVGSIFCTSFTSALYLRRYLEPGDKVYVVGNPAMGVELDKVGVEHIGIGTDNQITTQVIGSNVPPLDPKVKAVLAGMDGHISYSKMTKAVSYLAREGSLFVVTNLDTLFPLKNSDYRLPGTGALISSIITGSGRQPDVNCGKPGSFMIDCINEEVNFDPKRAIMIGDRLDTDILFGKNNNICTMLMMSGVTSYDELENLQKSKDALERKMIPEYYLDSIADFAKHLSV